MKSHLKVSLSLSLSVFTTQGSPNQAKWGKSRPISAEVALPQLQSEIKVALFLIRKKCVLYYKLCRQIRSSRNSVGPPKIDGVVDPMSSSWIFFSQKVWMLSVTCDRSMVFSGLSGFLHQYNWNIVEGSVKYHKTKSNLFKYKNVLFTTYYYMYRYM
jgi:hypothetical protein